MNFSLSRLSLSRLTGNSVFITGSRNSIEVKNSRVFNSFVPFYSSFFQNSAKFKNLELKKFLDTAIYISADTDYTNGYYSSRLKIENKEKIFIDTCSFTECSSLTKSGGALYVHKTNVTIIGSSFQYNKAKSSGAFELSDCRSINVTECLVKKSSATRIGGSFIDGHSDKDSSFVKNCNFTHNYAEKWVGAIRVQHGFGSINSCIFHNNSADFSGSVFMFTEKPSFRSFSYDKFIGNKARDSSAAITCYLMCFYGDAEECVFKDNVDGSIHFSSCSGTFDISNCVFSGPKEKEINVLFESSTVDVSYSRFNEK